MSLLDELLLFIVAVTKLDSGFFCGKALELSSSMLLDFLLLMVDLWIPQPIKFLIGKEKNVNNFNFLL